MNRATRAGLATAWITMGGGARRALFIHCSLASHRAWLPVMERLGDAATSTAFDLPGHGQSGDWSGAGDLLIRSAEVAATFHDGPEDGEVDLVGHSFGGVVALRMAAEHPGRVRTLTLVEPVLFAAARGTPEHDAHRAGFAPIDAAMARGDRAEATRLFTASWGGGHAPWEALPQAQRAEMVRRIPLVAASRPGLEEDSGGILDPGRLEAIAAPTLLVAGARADPVIARIHEALAARLPDARCSTIAEAGHMVPMSHPDRMAEEIRGQISRRGG